MIKHYVPKVHFKILNSNDINLDHDNVTVDDLSFNTDTFNDNTTRGYHSGGQGCDYMCLYLKDLDDYITMGLEICYDYTETIEEGDYHSPPHTSISNQDLWVNVTDIQMEVSKYDFDFDLNSELEGFVEEFIYDHLSY